MFDVKILQIFCVEFTKLFLTVKSFNFISLIMVLLTLVARVRDGLILATSIEGGDDVSLVV